MIGLIYLGQTDWKQRDKGTFVKEQHFSYAFPLELDGDVGVTFEYADLPRGRAGDGIFDRLVNLDGLGGWGSTGRS